MSAADNVRDEATERAVIAALLNGARVDDVAAPPDAFSNPEYRTVYEAILEALRRFTAVDAAMVRSVLEMGKAPAEVLELVDVLALADFRPENFPRYVDGLLEFHARRVAIRKMEAGIQAMSNPKTRVEVVAEETAAVLGGLGSGRDEAKGGEDVRAILSDYRDQMVAAEEGREPRAAYLPTPFAGHGEGAPFRGFPARKGVSCLGVVAARSGMGKTAMLATLLHFWACRMRKRIGLFGLEDGTRWLVERWVARDFGMNWGEVGTSLPEVGFVRHMDAPWIPEEFIDDKPAKTATYFPPRVSFFRALEAYEHILDERMFRHAAGGIAAPTLLAKCRRWIDSGAEVIVVDHGLQVDYTPGRDERLDYAIGKNVKRLMELTVATGVPIILAWHLNRTNGDESTPGMGDLKESGYLDANASTIQGLWRVKGPEGQPDRTFSNIIKSRRSGGIGKVIELAWAGESGMMAPDACKVVDFAREYADKRAAKKKGALGV